MPEQASSTNSEDYEVRVRTECAVKGSCQA
jgi:hypothetical protein